MSTDRGRRKTGRSRSRDRAPGSRPAVIRLAPGVRIDGGEEKHGVLVLVYPDGKVQLNKGAATILRLCDGSRNREGIVAEVMRRSRRHALAVEIVEFLDVAQARGWIIET